MTAARQTALVTGANRGLGLETCRQLAQRDIRVVLTSRDPSTGERAAATLRSDGLEVVYHPLDVTDPTAATRLAETVKAEYGSLDVLVNNAGVALNGFDADVVRQTLAVNFFGAVQVTDAFVPVMGNTGRIVMVSSGMGELSCLSRALRRRFDDTQLTCDTLHELMRTFVDDVETGRYRKQGWPGSAYRVSKVGLNAFTRILAGELSNTEIRVNAVCPGWVRTDMGGRTASRSVASGAKGIVWAATSATESGGFFRDGQAIAW